MQRKFMSVSFFYMTMNMKVVITTVLCATLAISTSEDSIFPQLKHLTGKSGKSEKNKLFSSLNFGRNKASSSSETKDKNSPENRIETDPMKLMVKHTIVVLNPGDSIKCGGIVLTRDRILIPHEPWPNIARQCIALIPHRMHESGVHSHSLKDIIGTIGVNLDIDVVELNSTVIYGDEIDNQRYVKELSSNQFGKADINEPAYGVQILTDDPKPKIKKFVNLRASRYFIYVKTEPGDEIPAYPGEPLFQFGKLIGLFRDIITDTEGTHYQYSIPPEDSNNLDMQCIRKN